MAASNQLRGLSCLNYVKGNTTLKSLCIFLQIKKVCAYSCYRYTGFFCILNPLVIGGLDISLLLGGNPWRCDCKLAYIKHLQSGRMMVSIIFYVVLNSFRGEYANNQNTGYRFIVRGHDKLLLS